MLFISYLAPCQKLALQDQSVVAAELASSDILSLAPPSHKPVFRLTGS